MRRRVWACSRHQYFSICSYQGPLQDAELIRTGYFKVYFPEYGLIELKRSNENTGDMAIVSSIKTKEIKDD